MGTDIHMSIVKNNEYIKRDIFDGRDREWFDNIRQRGYKDEYSKLFIMDGLSPQSPKEIDIKKLKKDGYFDFYFINVKEFKKWFSLYHPNLDAGWVTTYDKWRIENKGYIPEYINHYLDKDDNINDMCFVEVSNPYDSSAWLFHYLIKNEIPDDADIIYWFDC